ncbi:MAG: hypothetical protein PHE27_03220 [Alphaproteobacteria bacterium]|nr:hypothetical protein [Alphaproteobacteria bacterium]
MHFDAKIPFRVFSPSRIARAVSAFDKSTTMIVGTCWLAALVMMILAIVSVHAAVDYKKEAATASSVNPVLPTIKKVSIPPHELQKVVERLQKQFPDIKIDLRAPSGINVRTNDGNQFHQWITALNYVDTMAPEYRWTLKDFCTGSCSNGFLMSAGVYGQKTIIAMPNRSSRRK